MKELSRRRGIVVAATTLLTCAVSNRATAQTERAITVGLTAKTAVEWPTYVADELGFFKAYNLAPTFIVVGGVGSTAQQLVGGSLQLGELTSTQIVEATQGGAALRYYCENMGTPPYSILAQSQYKKYADLKGKSVMVAGPTDITAIFAERMLASGGLKMSDVDFVYDPASPDRYAALKAGRVAAAMLFAPFSFRAAADGFTNLGTLSSNMLPFLFVGWAASDAYAAGHPDVMTDFIKGYLRAVRWLNSSANRARAIEILVKQTNTSPEDAAKSYDLLVARGSVFPPTGVTEAKSFSAVIDALAEVKTLSPPLPPPTKFFDNRFALQAGRAL